MYSKKLSFLHLLIFLILLGKSQPSSSAYTNFIFNSFKSSKLTLDGEAQITPNGLLTLTNYTFPSQGHAFYPDPIPFKRSSSYSSNGSALSFSTSFIFAIQSQSPQVSGHGIVFVVTPKPSLSGSLPAQFLGLFNESNYGESSNHVFGVELDTTKSVGIDINSLRSIVSAPASYVPFPSSSSSSYINLTLFRGQPMRVWIEYSGTEMQTTVTIAPLNVEKPKIPLLTLRRDLSPVFNNNMYVGFSGSTGFQNVYHCILGWSFALNSSAADIDISKLPKLPRTPKKIPKMITIGVPVIAVAVMAAIVGGTVYVVYRQRKFAEEVDDWESDYGPHRFKYKDIYLATKGFKDKGLLGKGGFGRVYRGVLPKTKTEIAVKKISHESRQGMREFIAEIVSLGRLRHRNLVQLLGYCRRKGELVLVYDYMPNGSLDRYLHSSNNNNGVNILNLNWKQRFKIIKGVASGLLYLHEEWEQVVVHRDIKASNVLLDADLNGRLGDFGLARLYDHGSDPQTTHVAGTLGYLAPEFIRNGKATRSTDVFAFGAFLLEVACGLRPIDVKVEDEEECVMCEWVFGKWKKGELLLVVDPRLEGEFDDEEAETVLKLGLMCSSVDPGMRPTMREVIGYLEGVVKLPDLGGVTVGKEGFSDYVVSSHSPLLWMATTTTQYSSITDSLLSVGR